MKQFLTAIFFAILVSCTLLSPSPFQKKLDTNTKTLVSQYVKCGCKTEHPRLYTSSWSALILELYSDSSFILAGDFQYYGGPYQMLGHLSGHYVVEKEKLLLSVDKRQMISYDKCKPNIMIWDELINFEEVDSLHRIIFYVDSNVQQVYFCPVRGLSVKEQPWNCEGDYFYLKSVNWLPKPFLKDYIDSSFCREVTRYCRDSFPIVKQQKYR